MTGPALRRAGAVLAALGLVAVLIAVAVMTVARPTSAVSATAPAPSAAPVVVTAPGVLESRSGPVRVTARGEGPVRLAVGREDDVTAWVGAAAHATVTGLTSATEVAVSTTEGEPTTPDPEGSDLWVEEDAGDGSASLEHDPQPGAWLLLAAGDGSTPAPALTLTWDEPTTPGWALPLLVVGAVALVLGALPLLLARFGGRAARLAERVPAPSRSTARTPRKG